MISFILYMMKLRSREGQQVARGHTANKAAEAGFESGFLQLARATD